jgi:hypothetical protein
LLNPPSADEMKRKAEKVVAMVKVLERRFNITEED